MNYPTTADVKSANMRTLLCWQRELPAPQTDVERSVQRRIGRRIAELHLRTCDRPRGLFSEIFGVTQTELVDVLRRRP